MSRTDPTESVQRFLDGSSELSPLFTPQLAAEVPWDNVSILMIPNHRSDFLIALQAFLWDCLEGKIDTDHEVQVKSFRLMHDPWGSAPTFEEILKLKEEGTEEEKDLPIDQLMKKAKKISWYNRLNTGLSSFRFEGETIYAHFVNHDPKGEHYGFYEYRRAALLVKGRGKQELLKRVMQHFLEYSLKDAKEEPEEGPRYYAIYKFDAMNKYWRYEYWARGRHPESVILPQKTKDKLLEDVSRFLSDKSKKFYAEHGIPYQRGYLFYGPPGTGKSSMIAALASKFKRNVMVMSLAKKEITDDVFKMAIQTLRGNNAILALEDVDALFNENRLAENDKAPLTFSGLLNGLDGVGSSTGHITIMSTNHPEKLDHALIRPGRVDMVVEFPRSSHETSKKIFQSFYEEADPSLAEQFATKVVERFPDGVSMAALQHHFILHIEQPAETAVAEVDKIEGDR
eukprot:TRINITY_DN3912_c0_g3_i3.p1 TRINITY_DN3912_c0_g3~~TRINITY_DN3912_c0_g3_i3.p1  ORF type:complete len:455 (+),score=120.90 TRINITY_DN3912_c0_g3_i3:45-1409(+)